MANQPEYVCSRCDTPTERDLLMVKKAVFLEMGVGGRTFKSRVVGWLCPNCVRVDADWNQEKFKPPRAELKAVVNG